MKIDGIEEKIIWSIWFGGIDNMSNDRKECLESIKQKNKNFILVDESNLNYFCKKLNKSFDYLSLTHKSDYIRCYLMNEFGGCYTDIKKTDFSYDDTFSVLNSVKNYGYIGCGYRENSSNDIALTKEAQINKNRYYDFIGTSAFMFLKNTKFTNTWFDKVENILNLNEDNLKNFPGSYHPRATINGAHQDNTIEKKGYPFEWTEILGHIYHPLVYENKNKIIKILPRPRTENYR